MTSQHQPHTPSSAAVIALMFTFCPAVHAQARLPWLASPLVCQCHHRAAHRPVHLTIPARHRDEEESQCRVETPLGGEQHQPRAAALYGVRALHDSTGFHLLYHQFPLALYQCADRLHRCRRGDADDNLPPASRSVVS